MKKKGFTLVEIIVCVSIIAVVGVVIGLNSDKIFGGEKASEDVTTTIISAAEIFADSNSDIVTKLYDQGVAKVTIGELKNGGFLTEDLVDENGDVISEETPILITLNEDGYLEFTYNKSDEEQGYLIPGSLTIAAGDDFECDYYVGNVEGGFIFYDMNTQNISDTFEKVNSITGDKQYKCEENIGLDDSNSTYNIKYTYRIDGVTRTKEREVKVLKDFEYNIDESNFVSKQHYLEEISSDNYILYITDDSYDLTINTNYDDEPIQLVYEKGIEKQISNKFKNLTEGNYTFKINVSDKKNKYTESELLSKTDFVVSKTFNLRIKRVDNLNINNLVFKNENNEVVSKEKWTIGKSITFTLANEDIIVSRKYKLDTDSTPKTFSGNSIALIKIPAKKITIMLEDKLGRTFSKDYVINIDTIPTAPTVTSGTSTNYTLSKTFKIDLPKNTLSGNRYYYALGNSTPTSFNNTFTSSTLTLNISSLSGSNAKYLYLSACNEVGCSAWKKSNAYITKNISEWNNSDCTKDSTDNNTCHYVGNKSNNYVKYGGKLWRIYKITSGQLGLILDDDYTTSAYGQVGNCTAGCCNYGRYLYRYLGDSEPSNYESYGFKYKTIGNVLREFKLDDTNLLTYFYNNSYSNVKVGLLSKYDYMKVANCTSDISCSFLTNYIINGKNAFWLVDHSDSFNGDKGNYNSNVFAYAYNFIVESDGTISKIGSESNLGTITTNVSSVRPIIQISSKAKITGGDGTKDNAYTLG